MYWGVQNELSFPIRSGDDFLTDILYSKKGVVTLELKARRNTMVKLFNNSSIYNLQKNLKYYYTFTMKIMIILKWKFRIQPHFLDGISIYSKVNWKINDSNSLSFRYSKQRKKEI